MSKKLLKVVVDRSKWLTANVVIEKGIDSVLRNKETGFMCCLGFVCKTIGLKNEDINGMGFPSDLKNSIKDTINTELPKMLSSDGYKSSVSTIRLAEINDDEFITNKKRENLIKEEGKNIGVQFSFVGKAYKLKIRMLDNKEK